MIKEEKMALFYSFLSVTAFMFGGTESIIAWGLLIMANGWAIRSEQEKDAIDEFK